MIRLRVDDFPGTKKAEFNKHKMSNFLKFDQIISEELGVKYLLGVIPGSTQDGDLRHLGTLPYVEVGVHGVFHDETRQNEFMPFMTVHDRREQLTSVLDRFELMTDVRPRVYMPPHNVIDFRTCCAISDAGLEAFTGGPETSSQVHYWAENCSLQYLHSEAPLEYGRCDELLDRGSVEYMRENALSKTIYLTLHWTWEYNIGLEYMKNYFSLIADLVEDFDVA